jgi:hypothetical protein
LSVIVYAERTQRAANKPADEKKEVAHIMPRDSLPLPSFTTRAPCRIRAFGQRTTAARKLATASKSSSLL